VAKQGEVILSREEALKLLHILKWHMNDLGFLVLAGEAEDAEFHVRRLPPEKLIEYSRLILPPGRRGRVTLILAPPYEARARAMLVGILRSVE
jgi:hypothetical protein